MLEQAPKQRNDRVYIVRLVYYQQNRFELCDGFVKKEYCKKYDKVL